MTKSCCDMFTEPQPHLVAIQKTTREAVHRQILFTTIGISCVHDLEKSNPQPPISTSCCIPGDSQWPESGRDGWLIPPPLKGCGLATRAERRCWGCKRMIGLCFDDIVLICLVWSSLFNEKLSTYPGGLGVVRSNYQLLRETP